VPFFVGWLRGNLFIWGYEGECFERGVGVGLDVGILGFLAEGGLEGRWYGIFGLEAEYMVRC